MAIYVLFHVRSDLHATLFALRAHFHLKEFTTRPWVFFFRRGRGHVLSIVSHAFVPFADGYPGICPVLPRSGRAGSVDRRARRDLQWSRCRSGPPMFPGELGDSRKDTGASHRAVSHFAPQLRSRSFCHGRIGEGDGAPADGIRQLCVGIAGAGCKFGGERLAFFDISSGGSSRSEANGNTSLRRWRADPRQRVRNSRLGVLVCMAEVDLVHSLWSGLRSYSGFAVLICDVAITM